MGDQLILLGDGVASGGDALNSYYDLWRRVYGGQTAGTVTKIQISNNFAALIISSTVKITTPPPEGIAPLKVSGGGLWTPPTSYPKGRAAVFWTKGLPITRWDKRTMPSMAYWMAIAWNGTVFCAIAEDSTAAATSPDGITWTQRTMPVSAFWRAIAWNGTVFCAVCSQGGVAATSPDGVTWTQRTMPLGEWRAIAWNGTVFCAVAYGSTAAATSLDGITWAERTLPTTSYWAAIAWNGTVFCAVGGDTIAATSPDGITWTQRTMPVGGFWRAMSWNGTVFCAMITNTAIAATSPDGITWTQRTMPVSARWFATAWNGAVFCAVADGGAACAISPDGVTWTQRTMPLGEWRAIAWNGTVFCAVAYGGDFTTAATSSDLLSVDQSGITITQADINEINRRMKTGEPVIYFAGSAQDPDRELAFANITFLNGVGSGFSGLTVNALINRAVYRNGVLLGLITSNTATTITLADLTYTNSVPGNVIIAYPSSEVEQPGVTWLNGVGTGFVNLVPDSLIGKAVYRNGVLIGIITSNTATTVTISDLSYTNATPATAAVMAPLLASYAGSFNLQAIGSINMLASSPQTFASLAADDMLAAPPLPFTSLAGAMERTSTTEIYAFSGGHILHMGQQFEIRG